MKSNVKMIAALILPVTLAACAGGGDRPAAYAGDAALMPPAGTTYDAPTGPGAAQSGQLPPGYTPSASSGPYGTSGPDDRNFDQVGYVSMLQGGAPGQIAVSIPTLAQGSFVEVTSLTSGRTVLLENNVSAPLAGGKLIGLSPAAAAAMGLSGPNEAVRVRQVNPSAQDQAAVRRNSAPVRLNAPEALLVGLRKKLGAPPAAITPPPVSTSVPAPFVAKAPVAPSVVHPTSGGFFVQVAALSNKARADELARQLGGFVLSSGGLYRVQIGPLATQAKAEAARSKVAAQGFGDARIFEKR